MPSTADRPPLSPLKRARSAPPAPASRPLKRARAPPSSVSPLFLEPEPLPPVQRAALLAELRANALYPPQRRPSFMAGVVTPRDEAFFVLREDKENLTYRFSNQTLVAKEAPPELAALAREIKGRHYSAGARLGMLVNRYRDGSDSVDYHTDAERGLDQREPVVSVSLGAARRFLLKRLRNPAPRVLPANKHVLKDGTVAVMPAGMQSEWKHAIPKTKRAVGMRVSVTFRAHRRG